MEDELKHPDAMWLRVVDYLSGAATPEECAAMERWIALSPDNRSAFERVRLAWDKTPPRPEPPRSNFDINGLEARIAKNIGVPSLKSSSYADVRRGGMYSSVKVSQWVGYFSAIVAIIVYVLSVKYTLDQPGKPMVPTTRTYATNPGQRASIILADGSRVTLGPSTTLRIKSAGVDIAGEALFSVRQNTKHPFTVTAHGVTTRVLGTEFVVRAYDASRVRVAVRDGRVSVQSPALTAANAVVVSANQAVSVIPDAVPQVTRITDLATDFAWANGELVLRNVPLGEALIRMSRWYGREFRVADSALLALRVETVLPDDYNPSRINGLAKVLGARVIQSGSVITFSANP